MPRKFSLFLMIVVFQLISNSVNSQIRNNDFIQTAQNNAFEQYHKSRSEKLEIYKGKQYYNYRYHIGQPYFHINDFRPATIHYDGIQYDNIPLMYDLVRDEVVILHFNDYTKLILVNDYVESFTVSGYKYVHLRKNNVVIPNGLYQVLYEGDVKCYKKNIKRKREKTTNLILELEIVESKKYFLENENGIVVSFQKMSGLLRNLKEKRRELKKYIKENTLLEGDLDIAIQLVLTQYENIKRSEK
jgi:hypothetical protein